MKAVRLENGNLLIPMSGGTARGMRVDGYQEIDSLHPEYEAWTNRPDSIVDDNKCTDVPFGRFVFRPDADLSLIEGSVQQALDVEIVDGRADKNGVLVTFGELRGTQRRDGEGAGARNVDIVLGEAAT